MNEKIELSNLINDCLKSKQKLKYIKDEKIKILIESIIDSKRYKEIIKELNK